MIKAIQVTIKNLEQVAELTKGRIVGEHLDIDKRGVDFKNYLGQLTGAFIGDYVVITKSGCRLFHTAEQIHAVFDNIEWIK